MLSFFPVTVAVTQQCVKEGFSCSAGVVIRGSGLQDRGRCGRRVVQLVVGGRRRAGRGITIQWDRGV